MQEYVKDAVTKAIQKTYGLKGNGPITEAINNIQKEVTALYSTATMPAKSLCTLASFFKDKFSYSPSPLNNVGLPQNNVGD